MLAPARYGYEGTRACRPTADGYVERDGVRSFYEVYGDGEPTILLLPSWSLVHSRIWRGQIAYFARHCRVVVSDPRGNGRSDRPREPSAYRAHEFMEDAIAVMDATGTEAAITVSLSAGTAWNLMLAGLHPERVAGAVFVGPTSYGVEPFPAWSTIPFNEPWPADEPIRGHNRSVIQDRYHEFAEFWMRFCDPVPHSTRVIEVGIGMALDTTPDVVVATLDAAGMERANCMAERLAKGAAALRPLAESARCPVLVVQGEFDAVSPAHFGAALARDSRGELVTIARAGHHPGGRQPIRFNLELRRFVERLAGPRRPSS